MLKTFRQGISSPVGPDKITSPADFENLQLYIDAQEFGNITFASGSGDGDPIASVAGIGGALGVVDESNGYNWLYKASGIHGKPSFKKGVPTRSIFRDENKGSPALYETQVTLVYFFTGIFDGTIDQGSILCMNSPSYSRVHVVNSTTMSYIHNENATNVSISGTYDLTDLTMIALSYDDLSSLNIKINDGSFQNIDPRDFYDGGGVRFGGHNYVSAGLYHEFYGGLVYNRPLDESELNRLYDWGVARYS